MCWSSLTPSCLEKPILGTIPRAFSCTFCRQTLTPRPQHPTLALQSRRSKHHKGMDPALIIVLSLPPASPNASRWLRKGSDLTGPRQLSPSRDVHVFQDPRTIPCMLSSPFGSWTNLPP